MLIQQGNYTKLISMARKYPRSKSQIVETLWFVIVMLLLLLYNYMAVEIDPKKFKKLQNYSTQLSKKTNVIIRPNGLIDLSTFLT